MTQYVFNLLSKLFFTYLYMLIIKYLVLLENIRKVMFLSRYKLDITMKKQPLLLISCSY